MSPAIDGRLAVQVSLRKEYDLVMAEPIDPEPTLIHSFKNHLSIVVGFCDLLMTEVPPDDPKHADLEEISKAGRAALGLVPDLAKQVR